MTGTTASALFLVLLLVLPLSSLVARRMPIGKAAKMALAWLAIFAVAALLVAGGRSMSSGVWQRFTHAFNGDDQQVTGGTVRIVKSSDGHFWVSAEINGVKRPMLVDSGATFTSISAATAQAAALDLNESPFGTILSTANGDIAVTRSTVGRLEIGPITARDLPVVVSPAFGDTDVLGMNFLSRLKGWRVSGNTLILEPIT